MKDYFYYAGDILIFLMFLTALFNIIYLYLKGRKVIMFYLVLSLHCIAALWMLTKIPDTSIINAPNLGVITDILTIINYMIWCFGGLFWIAFCLVSAEVQLKRHKILLFILILSLGLTLIDFSLFLTGTFQGSPYIQNKVFLNIITLGNNTLSSLTIIYASYLFIAKGVKQSIGWKRTTIVIAIGVIAFVSLQLSEDYILVLTSYNHQVLEPFLYYSYYLCGYIVISYLSFSVVKENYLNIAPIALRKIADNINDAVIVTDNHNRIIDFNTRFREKFPQVPLKKDIGLAEFTNYIYRSIVNHGEARDVCNALTNPTLHRFEGEIELNHFEPKYFHVSIQSISGRKNKSLGRILSFSDITPYKMMTLELNHKNDELSKLYQDQNTMNRELTLMNQELSTLNDQLKEYALTVEELSALKERNRIAKEVHDTLGQTLSVLSSTLQVSLASFQTNPQETEKHLLEANRIVKQGLTELRSSISGLTGHEVNSANFQMALQRLCQGFMTSGLKIEFLIESPPVFPHLKVYPTLYRICQEALTNSLKHGKATEANIILKSTPRKLNLFIFDNGLGCNPIDLSQGFGLRGMKQRIEELNGRITFGSDGEQGFNIHVEIPLDGLENND